MMEIINIWEVNVGDILLVPGDMPGKLCVITVGDINDIGYITPVEKPAPHYAPHDDAQIVRLAPAGQPVSITLYKKKDETITLHHDL